MELEHGSHCVFCLNYHLVLVIKYRKKVINNKVSDRLKEIFKGVGESYDISIKEWNHDIDHIHVLFTVHPDTNLSKFLNSYKSASSRIIKNEFPYIRKYLWKEYFWSPSYCLISTGGATIEVIKRYIENQGL